MSNVMQYFLKVMFKALVVGTFTNSFPGIFVPLFPFFRLKKKAIPPRVFQEQFRN